mgnify:FL=1
MAICKECVNPRVFDEDGYEDPSVFHCPQRCSNQGKAYSVCDCDCMFPQEALAEQQAYEYRYNL